LGAGLGHFKEAPLTYRVVGFGIYSKVEFFFA